MVFSSITFLVYFLPIFLVVYFLVPRQFKNPVVLAFSIFFYAWGAPKFIFILLASTFIDFYIVQWMYHSVSVKQKKFLLALSIFINLGLLAYFKYANFFVENLNTTLHALGLENIGWTAIALPIGISFYTFQTLTYSIDVYANVHKPLKNVWDYMLYITMFPQLIAGPIVRFNTIADQITSRTHPYDERLQGFFRFCIGLAKKVLIANVLGETADAIFSLEYGTISSGTAWIGILAYTFQIYFDFSGYSDMAIGIGKMIGFKFPENFESPYTSESITEFWRRWHITLGDWMKNYLYIPLGGSKVKSKARIYINLWLVFLFSGLWHGAAWAFVFWGIYHGFFLVIERLFLSKLLKKTFKAVRIFYTFIVVVLGWVMFRIEDLSDSILYYRRLFAFDFEPTLFQANTSFYVSMIIAVFFAFFILLPGGQSVKSIVFDRSLESKTAYILAPVCFLLFLVSLSAVSTASFNPFIYFRF